MLARLVMRLVAAALFLVALLFPLRTTMTMRVVVDDNAATIVVLDRLPKDIKPDRGTDKAFEIVVVSGLNRRCCGQRGDKRAGGQKGGKDTCGHLAIPLR